ncbi:nucleoside triphosphate hydrolase [Pararhizobium haloflavum]|uniref:nucleoside triphosphate hydrolase n=1 Tax=Pararhizobium haloflavum TaxID=2037914 RepID=UPI000C17C824|nr:nucleoside triphosphate hydrolase [Pararhizobium haloflavum]
MRDMAGIAEGLLAGARASQRRLIVAIAGPPGSGKSTISEALRKAIDDREPGSAIIVPMDGFHLDNVVLDHRGLRHRKGAPETFDAAGYCETMRRIAERPQLSAAYPVFDRHLDLARAGAGIVDPGHRIVLTEGNYLLIDAAPWSELRTLFERTIWLDVADDVLEERLVRRWLYHGLGRQQAIKKALDNDMPNARFVKQNSRRADITING